MSVDSQRLAGLTADQKRDLLANLLKKKLQTSKRLHPLSHNQQSMWYMHQLAPDSAAYNVAFPARVRSAVDVATLKQAFQALVERHASLRTTFEAGGAPAECLRPAGRLL
jgi:hypothetical protein